LRKTSGADQPIVRGLDDPRAVDILTAEHWALLSTRTLITQEIFGRATLFIGVLSATAVALALVIQATRFGPETLSIAAFLLSVSLLIGVVTFVRAVVLNYEDAQCVAGMKLLRDGYSQIVPEVKRFFITHGPTPGEEARLAHGSAQRVANVATSLTTTSSVVGALNSILGAVVSIASAALHIVYAANFRRRHRL
jgi:hypothetical protein